MNLIKCPYCGAKLSPWDDRACPNCWERIDNLEPNAVQINAAFSADPNHSQPRILEPEEPPPLRKDSPSNGAEEGAVGCVVLLGLFLLVSGLSHAFGGDRKNAVAGLAAAGLLLGLAAAMAHEEKERASFLAFVRQNEADMQREGAIVYKGMKLSLDTHVTSFIGCASYAIHTSKWRSRFCLSGSYTAFALGFFFFAATFILGWWALPSGPILTIHALWKNLCGGDKRTIAQLIST